MRVFLVLPLSAALLGGCLTTQESPIYEQSTSYQGDLSTRHQYATDMPVAPTVVTYETAPAQAVTVQDYTAPTTILVSSPTDTAYGAGEVSGTPGFMAMQNTVPDQVETYVPATTVMATAPTDTAYSAGDVTGTPGFMATQQSFQVEIVETETAAPAVQSLPAAQFVNSAPLGAAGTPIAYDYRRNLVPVDATTTGLTGSETTRILPRVGQNYTVQQGDTVYSLSRKTCVGVNVIQAMNGLSADYAIKIGQSITLPTPVC